MLDRIKRNLALKLFVWAVKLDIQTVAICVEVIYEMVAEERGKEAGDGE